MGLQPIDLQTLFTQMDKVSKTQIAERDGAAVQQALQGAHLQQKVENHIREVNEAQDTGDGAEKVNDRKKENASKGGGKRHEEASEDNPDKKPSVIQDPLLGRRIDIEL